MPVIFSSSILLFFSISVQRSKNKTVHLTFYHGFFVFLVNGVGISDRQVVIHGFHYVAQLFFVEVSVDKLLALHDESVEFRQCTVHFTLIILYR